MARKKLGEMLIEAGLINEQGLRMALNEQKRWGGTLGRTLVELKLVNENELVRTLSQQLNLQSIDLDNLEIAQNVLDYVSGELAQQHSLVPFAQQMKFLDVAMTDPTNIGVIDELTIRTKLNIRPYLAGPRMIERAIGKFYGKGFVRTAHRPDLALPIEGHDVVEGDAQIENVRDGLTVFPRTTTSSSPPPVSAPRQKTPTIMREAEIAALQERISALEALVARDEQVLRKLLALLVEKNVATRDEIVERLG